MLKTLQALVIGLNLSYTPVEGLIQHAYVSHDNRLVDNNPFSGARDIDVALTRDGFLTPKKPIPFAGYWANELGQTAQQMVGICYLLETEADIYCDITIKALGDPK